MKSLSIEIDTKDRQLAADLRGGSKETEAIPISGGATLEIEGVIKRYGIEFPETIAVILHVSQDPSITLVASWLYDKLNGRATALRIESMEVAVSSAEIEIAIKRYGQGFKKPAGIIYDVKDYLYVREGAGQIIIRVLKDIYGNAPDKYLATLSTSRDITVPNYEFRFTGNYEGDVLQKMIDKLDATDDIKSVFHEK